MTNTTIYSHPYVYKITHPISGEFYIGYRKANKVPAEQDFGYIYKTSSKNLYHPFNEYTQTILAEFFTDTAGDDAYDFEQLTIFDNWSDPLLLNKSCFHGKKRWRNAGPSPLKGKTLSDKHKAKISLGSRSRCSRKPYSEETRAKMSLARKGKIHSTETRAKLSLARKGRLFSDETRAKMSLSQKGKPKKPLSNETKAKLSIANKGKLKGPHSDETKAKISLAARERQAHKTKSKLS